MKTRAFLLVLLAILLIATTSCGTNKVTLDPDANMIGTVTQASDDVDVDIVALIETAGSDYSTPEKGYQFYVVKFKFDNKGSGAVELREDDFVATVDGEEYYPIQGQLNFVPDKMGDSMNLESAASVTTKVVWMLPTDGSVYVVTYQPNYSDKVIKYNLVDPE